MANQNDCHNQNLRAERIRIINQQMEVHMQNMNIGPSHSKKSSIIHRFGIHARNPPTYELKYFKNKLKKLVTKLTQRRSGRFYSNKKIATNVLSSYSKDELTEGGYEVIVELNVDKFVTQIQSVKEIYVTNIKKLPRFIKDFTSLISLRVSGDLKTLPTEIQELPNLVYANFDNTEVPPRRDDGTRIFGDEYIAMGLTVDKFIKEYKVTIDNKNNALSKIRREFTAYFFNYQAEFERIEREERERELVS